MASIWSSAQKRPGVGITAPSTMPPWRSAVDLTASTTEPIAAGVLGPEVDSASSLKSAPCPSQASVSMLM